MKSRVIFSKWCMVITLLVIAMLVVLVFIIPVPAVKWIPLGAILLMCLSALFYMPLYVATTDNSLIIRRPLRSKRIPFGEIQGAELWTPTMAELRLCGSGGWFGYWGWFSEKPVGRYFAYYGKSSDCFLVRLKSGKKYLLSCQNPADIVAALPHSR